MKVVLDTKVLIAAFATRGLCQSVLELCLEEHQILASSQLLREFEENLKKKVRVPHQVAREAVTLLKNSSLVLLPEIISASVCRDPKDAGILGLAVKGNADCLVTGDKDLLILKHFQGIPILSPRDFWEFLKRQPGIKGPFVQEPRPRYGKRKGKRNGKK